MADEMPEILFNRFIDSRKFEYSEVQKLIEYLANNIDKNKTIRIIIYHAFNFDECRIWIIDDDTEIRYACTNREATRDYYSIHVEVFHATSVVASFDMERVANKGFNIYIYKIKDNKFLAIKYILNNIFPDTVVDSYIHAAEEPTRHTGILKSLDENTVLHVFVECVRRLSEKCAHTECKVDPRELIENNGVVAIGSELSYVCILKDFEGCNYFVFKLSNGEANGGCVATSEEALRLAREILGGDFEILDVENLAKLVPGGGE